MARSYARTSRTRCPACGHPVDVEVWLIVDLAERPDLAERVRQGTLHTIPCPRCGHEADVDAPLLVHQSERKRVFFVPPRGSSQEQSRQIAGQLLSRLTETFLYPRPNYLRRVMPVPGELLPGLLDAEDPRAVLEGMAAQGPLLNALQAFLTADTWDASRRAVVEHPELLSDEADALLKALLDGARTQGDEDAASILQEHRSLLHRSRQVGVAIAFAEKTGDADPKAGTADEMTGDTG